jgi:hypothetical protein
VEALTKSGISQKDIDKALTPEVLSNFVAEGGGNSSKLADLMLTQIKLNREGLGTEPGKELSGLIAAKNKYQELLQRGARPTYTGSLSRLTDASELDTLVGNTEELKNRGALKLPTKPINKESADRLSSYLQNLADRPQTRLPIPEVPLQELLPERFRNIQPATGVVK